MRIRVQVRIAASLAAGCALAASGLPAPPTPVPSGPRRVEIRAPSTLLTAGDLERLRGWTRRQGVEVDVAPEGARVSAGARVVRLALAPASPDFSRRLARFGVRPEGAGAGFAFDGRTYGAAEDGIAVRDPAQPLETLVLANGRDTAVRLLTRRLFRDREETDYLLISGELSKRGRFARADDRLVIDRKSDRDEIGDRDAFLRSLSPTERAGVQWRFAPSELPAVERLERLLARGVRPKKTLPLLVTVFPDAVTKARMTGSSRPADLARSGNEIRVDVDASAPPATGEAAAVLASAGFAAEEPKLLERPILLAALGARAAGRWWGREIAPFASFAARADVTVSAGEALGSWDEVSPVLAVGAAASWIEAGVRADGEPAVLRALAGLEAPLRAAIARWEKAALRVPAPAAPARRPLPPGFLRGISYAMANSIDAGYVSPRSRETLGRLARLGASSVAVMPFAFSPDADTPSLSFIHRRPQGETDEATVRAVADARSLGMSALVKPQIWVGGEVFVGRIAMRSEADWKKWFDLYRRFVVHHALVAESAGASLFCVGTELIATESRAAEWRAVIAAVRLATGAPLTYAANWVGGAVQVSFWDALDVIGVDFYDPLAADPEASDASLEAGARATTRPLAELSKRTGRQVVFTEAGYPLARSAWLAPHDENTGRPPSAADAARAIGAVHRALEREPWWRGVYWWKAFSSGREARPDETGFNVLGGLTEKAVADGFGRLARERRGAGR